MSPIYKLQNFRGMTRKIRNQNFHAPTGIHHKESVERFPYTPSRYKPKYTKLLANFQILIAKFFWGGRPISERYALASVGHPLPFVKFLGSIAL